MVRIRQSGQAATEMVFILPLLATLVGAGMVVLYCCWQGIKTQQAANFAARIQGQERVMGSISKDEIENENGVGIDVTTSGGDPDPTDSSGGSNDHPAHGSPVPNSVYEHIRKNVFDMFGNSSNNVYVPPPRIGQNVDKVTVVRIIQMPKIPFTTSPGRTLKLKAEAYGGEDTLMYGLPRWGHTSNSGADPEWKNITKDSANNPPQ